MFKLIICLYGIFQTAGFTNHRYCSVTHAHQLTESARFKQWRHQKCIATCINTVCKIFWIADICRNPPRIFLCKIAEHIFISLLSGSKYYDLDTLVPKDLIHHVIHQIKALLICQTWNHSDQEFIICLLQTDLFLQRKFVCFLIRSNISFVMLCDRRICLRIKNFVIQSVYNTREYKRFCPHQSIQSLAAFGRLNLLGISLTDGCNIIRIHNTAF